MLRITLVSSVIVSVLLWFAFQARTSKRDLLATGLFTAAGIFMLILVASFAGWVGG